MGRNVVKDPMQTSFFTDFAKARIRVYLIVWPLFIAAMMLDLDYSCNVTTTCFACGFRSAFKFLVQGHIASAFAECPLLGPVLALAAFSLADVTALLLLFLQHRRSRQGTK